MVGYIDRRLLEDVAPEVFGARTVAPTKRR
jgi:hypothetical protein